MLASVAVGRRGLSELQRSVARKDFLDRKMVRKLSQSDLAVHMSLAVLVARKMLAAR